METRFRTKQDSLIELINCTYDSNCAGNHPRYYKVQYREGPLQDYEFIPQTYYKIKPKYKESDFDYKKIESICQICFNKGYYIISIDGKIDRENKYTIQQLKVMENSTLKLKFTSIKGNIIEVIGVEKVDENYKYMIKVNGKHQEEYYSESQILAIQPD